MNLVVDIGNTSVKAAIFHRGKIEVKLSSFTEIKAAIKQQPITHCIISKTGSANPVEEFLEEQKFKKFSFGYELKLPISNCYETPQTVGTDRLALMSAAQKFYPKKNVLVIDTGTCITYNFLNAYAQFLGGAIAPGIEMRFKSLHHFTANLPQLSAQSVLKNYTAANDILLIGNSTEKSIASGVVNGVKAEVNGIVQQYKKEHKKLVVVVTGSGSNLFEKLIEPPTENLPDFQLEGLNYIVEFNL